MAARLSPGSFYGQIHKRRQFRELTFVESVYAPGLHIPDHRHIRAYFYLVLKGSCNETFEKKTRPVGPFTLVYYPHECLHADHWQCRGGACFNVEIPDAMLQRVGEFLPPVDHPAVFQSADAVWLGARLYKEFQQADGLSPLVMESLMLEILAAMTRDKGRWPQRAAPPWLVRARDLLHDRLAEPLGLEEIAGIVGVHPVHLCRAFRKHFRRTPGDYLRNLRVDFACRQLSQLSRSLAEIALAAGFVDQSHFTNMFRRATGMTPGEFRRQFGAR
jgi:AraC family transcriptional regulator